MHSWQCKTKSLFNSDAQIEAGGVVDFNYCVYNNDYDGGSLASYCIGNECCCFELLIWFCCSTGLSLTWPDPIPCVYCTSVQQTHG